MERTGSASRDHGLEKKKGIRSKHRLKMKTRKGGPAVWTSWEEGQREASLAEGENHLMHKEDETFTSSRNFKNPGHSSSLRDTCRGTQSPGPQDAMGKVRRASGVGVPH